MTTWAERADAAERTVVAHYVRRVAGLPGTALGRARPPGERTDGSWNYWWQAQLLDCLVDAEQRAPDAARRRLIDRVARSVRLRNRGWCTTFHDDMAWLALALGRVAATTGVEHRRARRILTDHLRGALDDHGVLSWRCGDGFVNTPANAPTAILLARAGDVSAAARITRWLLDHLTDPTTGLVLDGRRPDGVIVGDVYTYNQGVVIGALVELSGRDRDGPWAQRGAELTDDVARHLTRSGVLVGRQGDDGALFAGICARYLAVAARELGLPRARDVVLASAAAAWSRRDAASGLFAADAGPDASGQDTALSTQLGAWTELEAAAASGPP